MDIINFRVSTDSQALELWVRVPDGPYYKDITIKQIGIVSWDRYVASGFPNLIFNPDHDHKPEKPIPGIYLGTQTVLKDTGMWLSDDISGKNKQNVKEVVRRFNLRENLFLQQIHQAGMYYLYVEAEDSIESEDNLSANIPCCCFKQFTTACAINHFPIYNLIMKTVNSYEDKCMIAEDKLLDLYLKKKLITDAIQLSDYTAANKIFKDIYERELRRGDCFNGCRTHWPLGTSGMISDIKKSGCKTCG